jgi:hypothetical protein
MTSAAEMTTATDLIKEGERLALPSLLLSASTSGVRTAVWRSKSLIGPNGAQHWISIDASALTSIGVSLSSNIDVFRGKNAIAVHVPQPLSERAPGGTPLRATPTASFPPFEALCLFGGEVVGSWLRSLGCERTDWDDPRVYESAQRNEYIQEWQRRCPLYTGAGDVVVGGWHIQWPEDDGYSRPGWQMLLWTLRDAEPWIEVWRSDAGELRAVERIT